jgi:hypothetical protein
VAYRRCVEPIRSSWRKACKLAVVAAIIQTLQKAREFFVAAYQFGGG